MGGGGGVSRLKEITTERQVGRDEEAKRDVGKGTNINLQMQRQTDRQTHGDRQTEKKEGCDKKTARYQDISIEFTIFSYGAIFPYTIKRNPWLSAMWFYLIGRGK